MARATWNGVTLAESDSVKVVEGNLYFPPDSVNWEALAATDEHSRCYWKGKADYFDVVSGDTTNASAAWTYPKPWPLARNIEGHVAFWKGVTVAP